jgi:hypothetical protein
MGYRRTAQKYQAIGDPITSIFHTRDVYYNHTIHAQEEGLEMDIVMTLAMVSILVALVAVVLMAVLAQRALQARLRRSEVPIQAVRSEQRRRRID